MLEPIVNRDPGDETDAVDPHIETGLCVNTWCDDVALPEEEFCRDCFADALAAEAEFLGGEAA